MLKVSNAELLEDLRHRLRVMTVGQVATRIARDRDAARKRIERLCKTGNARCRTELVVVPDILSGPLVDHWPGDDEWDFGHVSYQLRKRFSVSPTSTLIVEAKDGDERTTRSSRKRELSHDLTCAEVYLYLLEQYPELAKYWRHEDALSGPRDVVPDAVIETPTERIIQEIGGKGYSAEKLRTIHHRHQQTRFQIW